MRHLHLWLRMQSMALGIPLIEQLIKMPDYVRRVKRIPDYDLSYMEMLSRLKRQGITGGVFGDVSIGTGAQHSLLRVDAPDSGGIL